MNILYHHRTRGDGVEGVHIRTLVGAFRRLGHRVRIAGPPGCGPESEEAGEGSGGSSAGWRERLRKFARSAPPALFEIAELAYNVYSFADVGLRILKERPDIIYERFTSNSFAPTLAGKLAGVPVVQEVNVTARIGRFRPLVFESLATGIEKWVQSASTLVVTVSGAFRDRLVQEGWNGRKILVCPNAIDPDRFAPAGPVASLPPHIGEEHTVAGFVGSFLPYHGLDLLVDIARELQEEYPDLRWLLVGDGVEKPRIEEEIARHGMADRFWMPGRVPHEEVPSYVRAMDIAVLPHAADFNSPMKLFEYMGLARPVVAPDSPAIEEVISHGRTGLLFERGSRESLRGAIEELAADVNLREELGQQARERVLEQHTWKKNAQRVVHALQEIEKSGKVTTR